MNKKINIKEIIKEGGLNHIIDKKINHFIWALIINGLFLLILAILIVKTTFMLQLIMGLVVLSLAYVLFYGAYKLSSLKKFLDKIIKF